MLRRLPFSSPRVSLLASGLMLCSLSSLRLALSEAWGTRVQSLLVYFLYSMVLMHWKTQAYEPPLQVCLPGGRLHLVPLRLVHGKTLGGGSGLLFSPHCEAVALRGLLCRLDFPLCVLKGGRQEARWWSHIRPTLSNVTLLTINLMVWFFFTNSETLMKPLCYFFKVKWNKETSITTLWIQKYPVTVLNHSPYSRHDFSMNCVHFGLLLPLIHFINWFWTSLPLFWGIALHRIPLLGIMYFCLLWLCLYTCGWVVVSEARKREVRYWVSL